MTPFLPVALLLALIAGEAAAQKTYRCGNTFQSYPCALNNATGGSGAAPAKSEDKGKGHGQSVKVPEPSAEEKKAEEAKQAQIAEAKKQEEAAKGKKVRCDKMRSDIGYIDAQTRGGTLSKTNLDRLAGERKQLEADMKKETC